MPKRGLATIRGIMLFENRLTHCYIGILNLTKKELLAFSIVYVLLANPFRRWFTQPVLQVLINRKSLSLSLSLSIVGIKYFYVFVV
jgi:hypothetical protein